MGKRQPVEYFVGKRFGLRVILGPKGKNRHGGNLWEYKCDCGRVATATKTVLERSISCGCHRRKVGGSTWLKPLSQTAVNYRLTGYKKGARARGLVWELADEEARGLFMGDCAYCGAPPAPAPHYYRGKKERAEEMCCVNGIDRVDNAVGYVVNNCVPCCKTCNLAKRQMSLSDFLAWIDRIRFYSGRPSLVERPKLTTCIEYSGDIIPTAPVTNIKLYA